jgi:hypothetical protein
VFPVRYELNFYILFRMNSVLKELNISDCRFTFLNPFAYASIFL